MRRVHVARQRKDVSDTKIRPACPDPIVYLITSALIHPRAHTTNVIASYARVGTWMGFWSSVLAIGTADRVRPIPVDVPPPPSPELPKGVRVTIASLSGISCIWSIRDTRARSHKDAYRRTSVSIVRLTINSMSTVHSTRDGSALFIIRCLSRFTRHGEICAKQRNMS